MSRKRLYPALPGGLLSKVSILASGVALTDSQVTTSIIADSAVTTAKLPDSAVTSAKLGDTAVITSKVNDKAITFAKIQDINGARLLGRMSSDSGVMVEVPLSAELRMDSGNDWLEIADSGIITGLLADSAVTSGKLGDTAVTTQKVNGNAITADKMYDSNVPRRIMMFHISDTTLTVGDTYATFFIPAEMDSYDLVRAEMTAKISSTTGNPTIQLRNVTNSQDMLSTKITMDTAEKTSYTAATPSVVNAAQDSVVTGNEIAVDVDSAGTCEDVWLILTFRKP